MRVYELADELGVRSVDVLDACDDVGLAGIDAGSELSDDQVKRVRFAFNQREVSALMASAASAERSSAPVLAPIADPTPPPGYAPPPGHAPSPGSAPPMLRQHSLGMHPLIKRSIWHFVLAHIVPCVGLYFFVSSVVLAGKGRRQIAWSNGRYSGDTAGLVIQILFWGELVLTVFLLAIYVAVGGASDRSSDQASPSCARTVSLAQR